MARERPQEGGGRCANTPAPEPVPGPGLGGRSRPGQCCPCGADRPAGREGVRRGRVVAYSGAPARIAGGPKCASAPRVVCTLQCGMRRAPVVTGSAPREAHRLPGDAVVNRPAACEAGGPASSARRCVSGRPAGRRTPRGSGSRLEGWPARSGRSPHGSRRRVRNRGRTPQPSRSRIGQGPVHLPRSADDGHDLDGPAALAEREPEAAVRRPTSGAPSRCRVRDRRRRRVRARRPARPAV